MKKKILSIASFAVISVSLSAQLGFWFPKAPFPTAGRSAATGFNVGTAPFVSCGIDSAGYKRSTFQFNPATNTWLQLTSLGGITGQGLGRDVTMSFVVGNNAYVVGGQGSIAYFDDTWKYDAVNDVWTQVQTFNGGGRRSAVSFAINGKGYVALGQAATGLKNDCWEYNPVTNNWAQKANFLGTPRRLSVAFVINNIAYVGTGDDGVFKNDFFAYDPSVNTWTPKAAFGGTPRYGSVGFALNGKGYIGFGYDNTLANRKDFWEYDPTGNTWVQIASFPGTARSNATAVSCPNNKCYMGLGYDSLYENDWYEFDPLSNGIDENISANDFTIFPNPMIDHCNIHFAERLQGDEISVSIFDMTGKELKKTEMKNAEQVEISRDNLSAGIYLVRISTDKHGSLSQRLMVQ